MTFLPLFRRQLGRQLKSTSTSRSGVLSSRSSVASRPRYFSEEAAGHLSSRIQIYISRSRDPLINLSVEHRLLQTSHPDSTVLILYINSPCVVFGRNQNPWLEVNLDRLRSDGNEDVQLVRRRSGGGTVFHDEGNVNFSVICPPPAFNRDKHAEMVVRALSTLGRGNTRVNERHDIVMDVPPTEGGTAARTFKISGSAYKLTRLRSLHHGTCLLRSPNLGLISPLLRSPAEPFIKARGVESVRSPVANVDVDPEAFVDAVAAEFERMHGVPDVRSGFGDEVMAEGEAALREGYREMEGRDWAFGQTPKFTFSTHPTEDDPRERPRRPFNVSLARLHWTVASSFLVYDVLIGHLPPRQASVHFEARRGIIEQFSIDGVEVTSPSLIGASVHDIDDWAARLSQAGTELDVAVAGAWMDGVLGTRFTTQRPQD